MNNFKLYKLLIVITVLFSVCFFEINISNLRVDNKRFLKIQEIKAENTRDNFNIKLSAKEKLFIKESGPLKAVSLDGGAPLHYKNSKDEIVGIAVGILEAIEDITGLTFQYELYDSIQEALTSDGDIVFGLVPIYTPDFLVLSKPYLTSKTILFMNSSLNPNDLSNELYAGIDGGALPDDVAVDKAVYYKNREETLNAVEKSKAGYGYGNEYSIAYYSIKNNYENIITIPKIKEVREYSVGINKGDDILLSIVNKAIDLIDDEMINHIILDSAATIDKKLTIPMIMNAYGTEIIAIAAIVIAILLFIIKSNINSKRELSLQNKRYLQLSNISNECMFEYDVKRKEIHFSEKCYELFATKDNMDILQTPLKEEILSNDSKENSKIIRLNLDNDSKGLFKIIQSDIYSKSGKKYYTIGKLLDVSEEVAEREELIKKAEIDGLTNLYNNSTTKRLIDNSLKNVNNTSNQALILLDCDNFKIINDNFGHLDGDKALKNLSKVLKDNFSTNDIIGRIGGDEFCVFIENSPSEKTITKICNRINKQLREINTKHSLTVSCGIVFRDDEISYKDLLKKADIALYKAKSRGEGKTVIYK